MIAGLVCISSAALLRIMATGTLKVDHVPVPAGSNMAKLLLLGLGVTLLSAGYLRLTKTCQAPSLKAALLLGLLAATAATALPLTSNDLFSNLHYGHLHVYQGVNPYTATAEQLRAGQFEPYVSRYWKTMPCVYGPLLSGLASLAVVLGGPGLWGGVIAYKGLLLLVALTLALLGWLHGRETAQPKIFWLWATSPIWLFEIAGQAHNDGLMVVLVACALLLSLRERQIAAAAILGLGIAAKYVAAVPLAFLLAWQALHKRLVLAGLMLITAAVALIPGYALFWDGWQTVVRPLSALGAPRFADSFLKFVYWASLPFGDQVVHYTYRVVWLALWGGLIYLCLRWMRAWPKDAPVHAPWATAGRMIQVHNILLNRHFLPWYLSWLIPLLACERDQSWWQLFYVHSYLALLHYALHVDHVASEPFNILLIHLVPTWMLIRMAKGKPALPGEFSQRFGL